MTARRCTLLALVLSLISAASLADDSESGWTVIDTDRGITVSRREQTACPLPAFRGKGPIRGNVLHVLALMLDMKRVDRWAYGIDEARVIERVDARTDFVYLYSDVPWPVRDRDMIVRREIEVVKPGEAFRITLRCAPEREPEHEGIVRVRDCRSAFVLRKLDLETTEVDYTMGLDPAGHIPSWMNAWIAKHVPFKTLVLIEEQAAETKGHYEASVRKWSSAM